MWVRIWTGTVGAASPPLEVLKAGASSHLRLIHLHISGWRWLLAVGWEISVSLHVGFSHLHVNTPCGGLFELPPSMVAECRGQVSPEREPGENCSTFYDFLPEVILITFVALLFRSGSFRLKRMGVVFNTTFYGRSVKGFQTCLT